MSVSKDYKGKGTKKGHPNHQKYAGFDRRAVKCFIWMQDRVKKKEGRVCLFPRSREGMEMFMKEMGSIPEGMKRPSVGRIKHDKGYEPGNVQWESHYYNSWKGRRDESDYLLPAKELPQIEREKPSTDWDLG